jgi:hypothetical protein
MHERGSNLCGEHFAEVFVLFFVLQPDCSIRFPSSLWCDPPNMSSVTYDHDDVFELPPNQEGGG